MAWLVFPHQAFTSKIGNHQWPAWRSLVLALKLKPLKRKKWGWVRRRAEVVPQLKGAMLQAEHYHELRLLGKPRQRRRSSVGAWAGLRFCVK